MSCSTENVSHLVWVWVEVDGGQLVPLSEGRPGLYVGNLGVVTDGLDVVRVGLALRSQHGHHTLRQDWKHQHQVNM